MLSGGKKSVCFPTGEMDKVQEGGVISGEVSPADLRTKQHAQRKREGISANEQEDAIPLLRFFKSNPEDCKGTGLGKQ